MTSRNLMSALAALVLLSLPHLAAAQTTEPPRLEVGGQVSTQTGERGSATWTPRLTVNLRPDSAVELSADVRPPTATAPGSRQSEVAGSIHFRQTLWENHRWQIFGVVGGGLHRTVIDSEAITVPGPDGPRIFQQRRRNEIGGAVHIGPAVQLSIADRLKLRADIRLTLSNSSGLRGMIGAAVPFGALPAGTRARQPRGDSLVNGIGIGGAVGALTGAVAGAFLTAVVCDDDCERGGLTVVAVTTTTGAGIGGLMGAILDAFRR